VSAYSGQQPFTRPGPRPARRAPPTRPAADRHL